MQNITFTGRKIFDGMMILGDPVQQRTEMPEDIKYLDEISTRLKDTDIAEFTSEYDAKGSPRLKLQNMEISFSQSDEYVDLHKVFIRDLSKKITHVFKKHEFEDSAYSSAFKSTVSTIQSILERLTKSI